MTKQATKSFEAMRIAPRRKALPECDPMPVIAKTIQPSPNFDALWQEGLLCRRRCAWCKKFMGYKSGDGTPGMTTDSICPECQKKLFAEVELEESMFYNKCMHCGEPTEYKITPFKHQRKVVKTYCCKQCDDWITEASYNGSLVTSPFVLDDVYLSKLPYWDFDNNCWSDELELELKAKALIDRIMKNYPLESPPIDGVSIRSQTIWFEEFAIKIKDNGNNEILPYGQLSTEDLQKLNAIMEETNV